MVANQKPYFKIDQYRIQTMTRTSSLLLQLVLLIPTRYLHDKIQAYNNKLPLLTTNQRLPASDRAWQVLDLMNQHVIPLQNMLNLIAQIIDAVCKKQDFHWFFTWLSPLMRQIQRELGAQQRAVVALKSALAKEIVALSKKDLNSDLKVTIYDNLRQLQLSQDLARIKLPQVAVLANKTKSKHSQAAQQHFMRMHRWIKDMHRRTLMLHPTPFQDVQDDLVLYLLGSWGSILWYVAFFAISSLIYLGLSVTLVPVVALMVPAVVAQGLSSALFYGIGMMPLWYLMVNQVHWMVNTIYKLRQLQPKQHVLNILDWIQQAELTSINYLAPSIINIESFDFQVLSDRLCALNQAHQVLRVNMQQRCPAMLGLCVTVRDKFSDQKHTLKRSVEKLVDHVIENIGNEIELLVKSNDKVALKNFFPNSQIEAIAKFIRQHGTPRQFDRYERATNIVERWQESCVQELGLSKEPQASHYPWGGFAVRKDYLNGWSILIDSFMLKGPKKDAALALNRLLQNKSTMTAQALAESVNQVSSNAEPLLKSIQSIILKTLPHRSYAEASLLSERDKKQCRQWHLKHQHQLTQSQLFLADLLVKSKYKSAAQPSTQQLTKVLMDYHADNYVAASQGNAEKIRSNQAAVIKAIKSFDGLTSWQYQLIAFLPKGLQLKYKNSMAKQRLAHVKPNCMTTFDLALCHGLKLGRVALKQRDMSYAARNESASKLRQSI